MAFTFRNKTWSGNLFSEFNLLNDCSSPVRLDVSSFVHLQLSTQFLLIIRCMIYYNEKRKRIQFWWKAPFINYYTHLGWDTHWKTSMASVIVHSSIQICSSSLSTTAPLVKVYAAHCLSAAFKWLLCDLWTTPCLLSENYLSTKLAMFWLWS